MSIDTFTGVNIDEVRARVSELNIELRELKARKRARRRMTVIDHFVTMIRKAI